MLGRQTVAVIPYYIDQPFLRPGLVNFSYELGAVRRNFGIENMDYHRPLLIGSFQKGLTNHWTAGWHGEWVSNTQTFGINSSHVLYHFAQIDWAGALSHYDKEIGALGLVGCQRKTPWYSVGIRAVGATQAFRQLGIQEEALAPKLILQSHASMTKKNWGTLTVNYTERLGRTEENIAVTMLSFYKNIFRNYFYMMSYTHQSSDTSNNNSYYFSLAWSPKPSYTSSLSYELSNFQKGSTLSFSKNLPTHTGYGYNLFASEINSHIKADFLMQSNYGQYQAHFSRFNDKDNYAFDTRGSLLFFDRQFLLSRKIEGSFVLAEVPKLENIPVYKDNQLIGKTNKKGYLLISQTLPYDENMISIHPEELPLNTKIEADKLSAYPYYKSGELVRFPIFSVQNIDFTLKMPNQKSPPPGAIVILEKGESYPVGYEGRVYITDLNYQPDISGEVQWGNQSCLFSVDLPSKNDLPILNLGVITCSPFFDSNN